MAEPNPNNKAARARSAGYPDRRIASRSDFWRGVPDAIAALLFCVGVMLVPPLAALDLAVGLACQNLSPSACLAIFQPATD